VPNKYPALVPDAAAQGSGEGNPLFLRRPARGHHEVIVEGPEHRLSAAPSSPEVLRDVFRAAKARHAAFASDPALEHFALFKNHGTAGGASLQHPHWQLVASPVVPPALQRELSVADEYRRRVDRALYDDIVTAELESGVRVVEATPEFAVLTAYAPQWMGETWIVPRRPGASIGELDEGVLAVFAELLRRTLARVEELLDRPPLNVVVHSAPLRADVDASYRWHARVQPRLGTLAGFELGSGVSIVTLAPEDAAEAMRRMTP
jgi:UDPglucose--hexose-1-phosphate uridylyltransferase